MSLRVSEADFIAAARNHPTFTEAAKSLNMDLPNFRRRCKRLEEKLGTKFTTLAVQSPDRHPDTNPARLCQDIKNGVILVGSDAHYFPGSVTAAHKAFVKLAKELKPSVIVMNGDVFDGATISRWPRIGWDKKPTVRDELQVCQERLTEIEDAAPRAVRIWPLGNHDARFETRLAAQAPEYEGIRGFQLKDHFPDWKGCWSFFVNDNVVIKHRFKGGIHATHTNTLWAGRTMVTGHLHSLKVTPLTDYNGIRYGVDTGTLADINGEQTVDYCEDNPVNWRSGFVVLTFHEGKLLWPEVCCVDEGTAWFRGRVV